MYWFWHFPGQAPTVTCSKNNDVRIQPVALNQAAGCFSCNYPDEKTSLNAESGKNVLEGFQQAPAGRVVDGLADRLGGGG